MEDGELEADPGLLVGAAEALREPLGQPGDEIGEGIKDDEHPADADHVEKEMGAGGAFGVGRGADGGEPRGHGGADVFAEDDGGRLVEADPPLDGQGHGDGHGRGRRLHHEGEDDPEHEEKEDGEIAVAARAGDEVLHLAGLLLQGGVGAAEHAFHIGHGALEQIEPEKEEAESDEDLAEVFAPVLSDEKEGQTDPDDGNGDVGEREFADEGDDPRGHGGAEIGPHDDPDRFEEGEKARVDKADDHHGGGRGGLHHAGDEQSRENRGEAVVRHRRHHLAHAVSRDALDALAHDFHAVEEDAEGTEDLKDEDEGIHIAGDGTLNLCAM